MSKRGRCESWTFIVPVANLMLTEAVSREFRLDRVTLVHKDRLPYVRKRHGLSVPVSELKKRVANSFFKEADAYAVVRETGTREEVERRCLKMVREELHLLSVSEMGFSRRGIVRPAVPKGEEVHSTTSFLSVRGRDSTSIYHYHHSRVTSPWREMVLNASWKHFQDQVLFTNLLKILRGETKVKSSWRDELRRASVMIGESVGANHLLKSFVWNMAALEMLITRQGDKLEQTLPRRAEALLGWTGYWESEGYEARLKDVYVKRNRLLHSGQREDITEQDFAFTDHLLLNLLANLVNLPRLFGSKTDVIQFSERVEAERTLGVKPRVQPKDLRFFRPRKVRY